MSVDGQVQHSLAQGQSSRTQHVSESNIDVVPDMSDRVRTLTEKGDTLYQTEKDKRDRNLCRAWDNVEIITTQFSKCSIDLLSLRKVEKTLAKSFSKYNELYVEFTGFLSRTNTKQSIIDLELYTDLCKTHTLIYEKASATLDNLIELAMENISVRSRSSKRTKSICTGQSNASAVSFLLLQKRVQAEKARETVEYVEKEADIRRQKAVIDEKQLFSTAQAERKKVDLDTDLNLLQHRKEAAVAEAELRAVQYASDFNGETDVKKVEPFIPNDDSLERTRRYVEQLPVHHNPEEEEEPRTYLAPRAPESNIILRSNADSNLALTNKARGDCHISHQNQHVSAALNPNTDSFYPALQPSELTRFLLRKELLFSRLSKYDDRPESYAVWKYGFLRVMRELQVNADEELDMLLKWLGPDSTKHAQSLRAANATNPQRGVQQVWDRLDERYGCPEMVEAALKSKLSNFPKLSNRDNKKLYELADIVAEIESLKNDEKYRSQLAYFDSSSGVIPIVNKLPYGLQEKWTSYAVGYKKRHGVSFPPFSEFLIFLQDISKTRNDPSFAYDLAPNYTAKENCVGKNTNYKAKTVVSSRKTDVVQPSEQINMESENRCPIHKTNHSLNKCRTFRAKPIAERKSILRELRICYKCCSSTGHIAKSCTQAVKCEECGRNNHATALHISTDQPNKFYHGSNYGGEKIKDSEQRKSEQSTTNKATCTQICGEGFSGKSCAKTILVKVYNVEEPHNVRKMYVIIDDQSNVSLARSDFFDLLNVQGTEVPYTLSSCAGLTKTYGRRASGFIIESLDGETTLNLPTLLECDQIPDFRNEIPTPEVADNYNHLRDISKYIPPLDSEANILMLIGRDLIEAHHVLDQRIGPPNTPYAQRLRLGWVIIGEACLGKVHKPSHVNVNKTYMLHNGRSTICEPCPSKFNVNETPNTDPEDCNATSSKASPTKNEVCDIGFSIFARTKDDDKEGLSIDDKLFLQIMDKEVHRDTEGNWVAPLPFYAPRQRLPNNRSQAVKRAKFLHSSLQRNPTKKEHFVTFMREILDKGHAELAPPLANEEECWYLPIFGIYHPQKRDQIRAVFDSSAKYDGVSLNNVLLKGPDLMNSLLGVLLRFRREPVAVTADVQQMFYCFKVREDHRNFLRFLWYKDNDPNNDLMDYRMCVHVFGNSPSPAVASYCLRRIAQEGQEDFGNDVKYFVQRNFYVDDGLTSLPTSIEAIDLMKRTQCALRTGGNLHLHKIASNNPDVMEAFPVDERAKDLKDLHLGIDTLPTRRSLGLSWNLMLDTFTYQLSDIDKPYTRRGILSTVNSLYDPLGFIAPVVIRGKLIIRSLLEETTDWDKPLSMEKQKEWHIWKESLKSLEALNIPRAYANGSIEQATKKELHIFADASEEAIAAVAYLRVVDQNDVPQVGFVLGKAKVAPRHGHTIPRLELCAAVLATEITDFIKDNLDLNIDSVSFYSDSKIVLGYIHNRSRRFNVYVENRVERIHKSSQPDQWQYISTNENPADVATRSVPASRIKNSCWLTGPKRLQEEREEESILFPLSDPDNDQELKPHVMTTTVTDYLPLGSHRYERFSVWRNLVNAIVRLSHIAESFSKKNTCRGWHTCLESKTVIAYNTAQQLIIREVQHESYKKELACNREKRRLPKDSPLLALSPIIDDAGILRVGGRLNKAEIDAEMKNPIIIPGRHHIATLLVRHHHESIKHQGRHFTEGAIRAAGLWIVGGRRLISSVLHRCVKCRKQRGKVQYQKMSDLPLDRLKPAPPFSYVGVDTFGPWSIVTRRTRGGQANNKRWAIMFTCLTSRAVHIEVVEDMTSSAFINAMRRFISIRGKVIEFRSDRGTNFVGAIDDLKINAVNVERDPTKSFLYDNGAVWRFNPPHSSHMGGVWERMIGVTRRILDSMMADVSSRNLTHEVLVTFMAEVSAIVNARPIVPVSSDPERPFILSPATLLTQKTDHVDEAVLQYDFKDLYKAQWKRVQSLADTFWHRWKQEYLHTLQSRRKWQQDRPNLMKGDIVLLKEKSSCRNQWPTGMIMNPIPGSDDKVRKAEVRIYRDNKISTYTRPVTEMVLLLSEQSA